MTPEQREKFLDASGGHAGILQGLLSALMENPQSFANSDQPGSMERVSSLPAVKEECRKIYEGLRTEEQDGLRAFARGELDKIAPLTGKSLLAKGVLRRENNGTRFFCQVFERYVRSLA